MKILFDGQIFRRQRAGGVNRYFAEVMSGLPEHWVPLVSGASDFGEQSPRHKNSRAVNPLRFRPKRLEHYLIHQWWKPRLARSIDLLHPTYYNLTGQLHLSDFKCPVVITVYDMIYARFAAQMSGSEGWFSRQRECVLRADRVVCISQATEADLLEYIPEAAGKTVVIYLASSFTAPSPCEENLFANPTFLYVGNRGGYKNFSFLLRAFAKAASIASNIRLIVAGPPLESEELWQLHLLGISDRVQQVVYPSEKTLEQLYRVSVALLYPSLCEGFGIPPLEAMSCGTLPITADTTSLPEVVGDAGIMLDPTDQDAWTECILKVAQPFQGRTELINRGFVRAKQFSWADCVRRHVDVYNQLA